MFGKGLGFNIMICVIWVVFGAWIATGFEFSCDSREWRKEPRIYLN
jgi:hypothetical protein